MILLAEMITLDTSLLGGAGVALGGGGLLTFWRLVSKFSDWLDGEKGRREKEEEHRKKEEEHWRREEFMLAQAIGVPSVREFPNTPVRPTEAR